MSVLYEDTINLSSGQINDELLVILWMIINMYFEKKWAGKKKKIYSGKKEKTGPVKIIE